jgi:GNAT superfamily N-acetyltransferase
MHHPTSISTIVVESHVDDTEILGVIPDLARLRIHVFREFPYLYDGDVSYEAEYLKLYAATSGSVVVTARDLAAGGRIVGAATAMPLAAAHDEVLAAFRRSGLPVNHLYYCAESVLEPDYRGRGIGHAFFDHREQIAQELGFTECCFLSVVRPSNHPGQPPGYRPHDQFWQKRSYSRAIGFEASFSWRDLDETEPSPKPMALWKRMLPS